MLAVLGSIPNSPEKKVATHLRIATYSLWNAPMKVKHIYTEVKIRQQESLQVPPRLYPSPQPGMPSCPALPKKAATPTNSGVTAQQIVVLPLGHVGLVLP